MFKKLLCRRLITVDGEGLGSITSRCFGNEATLKVRPEGAAEIELREGLAKARLGVSGRKFAIQKAFSCLFYTVKGLVKFSLKLSK